MSILPAGRVRTPPKKKKKLDIDARDDEIPFVCSSIARSIRTMGIAGVYSRIQRGIPVERCAGNLVIG